MAISEGFLVHFIMTSLPSQFGPFKINYNTQKDKWKMSELIAMCVQEEEKLKVEKPDMAHLTIGPNKKSFKKGKGKKNKQGYLTSKRLSKRERTITLGNRTEVEIEAIGTLRLILDTGFIMDLVTESSQHLSSFALFLREHGIIANYTMPGTPSKMV
ncbi:hypothetical protein CK203_091597 [Vitis vinifera]|uniref:Uncharacterized protein n=1 Tax=Vitis vinifera TaxID=29760 RepID=A0A438D0R6_VITVI|nr:hypothetical protein CK203_091597 [Vitis vinifera]